MLLDAVSEDHPRMALQRVVQHWLEMGMERDAVLATIEQAQQQLRAANQHEQAEWIAELLDGLNGWCRV